jgi:hypothetical protein
MPPPPPEAPSRRRMRWSAQDERVLEQYYTSHGSPYTAALLGRTLIAVRHRAQILGVPGFETLTWSERETERLKSLFPKFRIEEIARRLKRSFGSVQGKLVMLGLLDEGPPDWSPEEDELLRRRYPGALKADEYGAGRRSGAWSIERLAQHLGRTVAALHTRASNLGMSRYADARPWTAADDRRLRRLKREAAPPGEMARALRRTKNDVVERMRELGLARTMPGWTEAEDDALRSMIGSVDRDEIAARLGRTRNAVNARVVTLGIAPPRSRPWTARESATLCRLYGTMPVAEVAKRLDRSVDAVSSRAAVLDLRSYVHSSWTDDEDNALRRLYLERRGYGEIAQLLGRSENSIEGRIRRLGLTSEQPMRRRWSREEDARLRSLYATHTYREIAAQLDRTANAVMLRAQALGLAPPATDRYSEQDDAFLRTHYPTMTAQQIADHLGRSRVSVIVRVRRLGLRKSAHS